MIFSSLFEASAVAVLSLHRFRLQCNCSDLALPLYMFVVAVLTTLPSLCYAMSSLLRGCLLQGRSQEETTTEANTRSVVRNQPYEIF